MMVQMNLQCIDHFKDSNEKVKSEQKISHSSFQEFENTMETK